MRIPQPFFRKSKQAWYVEFNGKQISLGKDETAAKAKYCDILRDKGIASSEPGTCTLHELIDGYLDWAKGNREAGTYVDRAKLLDSARLGVHEFRKRNKPSFKQFVPSTVLAAQLTHRMVETWLKQRDTRSSSTTRHYIAVISIMFNWGIRVGYVVKNPIATMDKPMAQVREEFIPPEKFESFLASIDNQALRDYVQFALNTGARAQEIRVLEAAHLNRETRRFVLPLNQSKGRKRRRVIYLNDAAFALASRLADANPSGKLFRNTFGRPWSGGAVAQAMKPLKNLLNMPGFCATVLRHSFAHKCLTDGMDASTIAKLMGHVDTNMLNTRYGHLEESAYLDEAANKFNIGNTTGKLGHDPAGIAKQLAAKYGPSAFVECLELMANAAKIDDLPLARAFRDASRFLESQEPPQTQLSVVG